MPAYQGRGVALPEVVLSGVTTVDISLPLLFRRFWLELTARLASSPGGNPGNTLLFGTGGSIDTTAANYDRQLQLATTGALNAIDGALGTPLLGPPTIASDTANFFMTGTYEIMNPADSMIKTLQGIDYNPALSWVSTQRAIWKNAGQINIMRFTAPAALAAGSFLRIYGEI